MRVPLAEAARSAGLGRGGKGLPVGSPSGHHALVCDTFQLVSTARKTNPPKNPDAWKDALRNVPKGPPLSPDQLKDIERFEKERAAGARGYTLDEAEELLYPRRK